MPDRDDMPDPMDKAYLRAEQALDDEAARAARRARILAAVEQDQGMPPASAPAPRGPMRRYGGWLAAACVAGVSVITAEQVWRTAPDHPPSAPPAAKAPAPATETPKTQMAAPPAAPSARTSAPPPAATTVRPRSEARSVASLAQRDEQPAPSSPPPPPPPLPAVAAPPPLPLPPVEKPIAPLQFAPADRSVAVAPLAAQPAQGVAAKAGLAPPNGGKEIEEVVVTGSRVSRRDRAAAPAPAPITVAPLISGPLKALDGPSRLREAAAAGWTADIEALLSQGVPIDAADERGETALMKSIGANQFDAVVILRSHGASLDVKNRAGVSARDMAAEKNDVSLNEALNISQ